MMLRYSTYILLIALIFLTDTVKAQKFYNTEIAAKIEIVESNGLYLITANASNLTGLNRSIRYKFSIIQRDGTNNPKKEEAEGRFVIEPSQKVILNDYAMLIEKSKDALILLLVYDGENLIGKDRVIVAEIIDEIPKVGERTILSQALQQGQSIGLTGLIIEDTKTKAGRDFYRYFFQKCSIDNIKWSKDIIIKEDFGLVRSTVIKVIEGTTTIVKFNAQPRDEFLRKASEECIRQVQGHFNQLARTKQLLTSY
jgi:hypothetical protein